MNTTFDTYMVASEGLNDAMQYLSSNPSLEEISQVIEGIRADNAEPYERARLSTIRCELKKYLAKCLSN